MSTPEHGTETPHWLLLLMTKWFWLLMTKLRPRKANSIVLLNLLAAVNHHLKYAFIWSARIRGWKYCFTHFWVDGSSHHTMGIRGWAPRHFSMEDSYGSKMNLRKIVNTFEVGWNEGNRKAAVFLAISAHKELWIKSSQIKFQTIRRLII